MPASNAIPLRADCERCVGLCCVAPDFSKSADFAIDKPAGVPCRNLSTDFRCTIHAKLRENGFAGCAVYDCFGAGQRITAMYEGKSWREAPEMLDAFQPMRDRHELLWHLVAAQRLSDDPALQQEIDRIDDGEIREQRRRANELLLRVSASARGDGGPDMTGLDLAGKDLRATDLRDAMLFNACLIGANLSGSDLRRADLRAADLRATDVRGANLRDCLFLTQMQVDAARGNRATRLPKSISRPRHW